MEKLTKENCLPGTKAIVNDRKSPLNESFGATRNGLVCFPFNPEGVLIDEEIELLPGAPITLQSPPKRFNGNGNQVKFTIDGSSIIYSAWWSAIKAKVDIL
jgi:hypothetical protein